MTTGKTTALTRQTSVVKVMSLLFSVLSRFVTAFLPRSKHLLISQLQSPSTVILEPKKISIVSLSIGHELIGLEAMILVFGILSFKPAFSFSLSPSSSERENFSRTPAPSSLWGLRVRGWWLKQLHSKEKRGAENLKH